MNSAASICNVLLVFDKAFLYIKLETRVVICPEAIDVCQNLRPAHVAYDDSDRCVSV